MKGLFLGLGLVILLITKSSFAATGLEYYFNSNLVADENTTTTYETHTTTAVDRSAEAGSKDFYVIAHLAYYGYATEYVKVRLFQDDSTTLGEIGESGNGFDPVTSIAYSVTQGYTFNFVKKVTLDNTSHNFKIQHALDSGGSGGTWGYSSSIVVIEASANSEYAETAGPTKTGATTTDVDFVTLTFTPGTEQVYLFIWATECSAEDESSPGTDGGEFENTTDTVIFNQENHAELMQAGNDNRWRTIGGFAFETVQTSSHTYKIQMDGAGSADEFSMRRGAIIAIPVSDLENVYTDSQTAKSFHDGSDGYTDTGAALSSQAVNAKDHLIIGAFEASNEATAGPAYPGVKLLVDTDEILNTNTADRDEDLNEFYINFLVYGKTFSSGSYDFKIQATSASATDTYRGCIRNAYLAVCEIPAAAAPPAGAPQVITIQMGKSEEEKKEWVIAKFKEDYASGKIKE